MLSAILCIPLASYDGDQVRCQGWSDAIRIVAASGRFDAPEVRCDAQDRANPNRWCDTGAGIASRDWLRAFLASGEVRVTCAGRDRYQRHLCRVTVNGRDVGDASVRAGHGRIVR